MSLKQDADSELYKGFEISIQRLSGPESEWILPDEDVSTASLAKRVAGGVTTVFSQAILAELRMRTRFRLCELTAKAISYKWTNAHLPENIEDFTTSEERTDPLGGRFVFRKEKDGTWFKIVRTGNDALGEVRLGAFTPTPVQGSTPAETPHA